MSMACASVNDITISALSPAAGERRKKLQTDAFDFASRRNPSSAGMLVLSPRRKAGSPGSPDFAGKRIL